MKFICPLIAVSDMEKSRYFYEHVLKQQVKFDFGENIMFHGDFAIHLKSHFQKLIDNRQIVNGGNNFELYFEYNDVDSVAEELKKHGVTFVHEVREQPWRQKVVRFYDPDNHIIEIGESMEYLVLRLFNEGVSIEDISEVTCMPLSFVQASIAENK